MATRIKTSKKPKTESNGSALLEALKFISVAQHSEGENWQTHCLIDNDRISAYDGGLSAGIKVEPTSIHACPHTKTLIEALSRCEDSVSITQLDSGRLSVKSGKFRALVPCLEMDLLGPPFPDDPCATLTDALKTALGSVSQAADDNPGEHQPYKGAILMGPGSVTASNGHVLLQAWHGIDLPPNILLPKASALIIAKQKKEMKRFGFSLNSVTFYFDDESYIKTQLFAFEKYPDFERILNVSDRQFVPMVSGFFEALDKVESFSETKAVYIHSGALHSHPEEQQKGASFDVEGLQLEAIFNIEYLKICKDHMIDVAWSEKPAQATLFNSPLVRGAIMPRNF